MVLSLNCIEFREIIPQIGRVIALNAQQTVQRTVVVGYVPAAVEVKMFPLISTSRETRNTGEVEIVHGHFVTILVTTTESVTF